jgi:hypothetical protein
MPNTETAGGNMKHLDVASLVVPRPLITQSIMSLFKFARFDGIQVRWVAHVDPVETMTADLPSCLAEIEKLKRLFAECDVVVSPKRIGHGGSFLNVMSRCRGDCIYLEDDKVFVSDIDFNNVVGKGIDFQSLGGNRTPGNTMPAYWSERLVRHVVAQGHLYQGGNMEQWLKRQYFGHDFVNGSRRKSYTTDIGVKSLDDRGLVRKLDDQGNLYYAKKPDLTIVLWKHLSWPFDYYQASRTWALGDGYQTIRLEEGQPVDWGSIKTTHVMILSTAVGFRGYSKHLSFLDFIGQGKDFFGFPDDIKGPYLLVGKTDVLKRLAGKQTLPKEIVRAAWGHADTKNGSVKHDAGRLAGAYGIQMMLSAYGKLA